MIRHATERQLDDAMRLTNQTTASKALVDCVRIAEHATAEVRSLKSEIYVLKEELAYARQVISRAKDSAASLLDYVAQGDLLNG